MKERLEKIEKKMQEKIMARFRTLEDSCSSCNAAIKTMLKKEEEEEGLEIVRILVLGEDGEDIHEFCTINGIEFDPTRSQFADGELDEMEQVEAEWPFGERDYEEGAWLVEEDEDEE